MSIFHILNRSNEHILKFISRIARHIAGQRTKATIVSTAVVNWNSGEAKQSNRPSTETSEIGPTVYSLKF